MYSRYFFIYFTFLFIPVMVFGQVSQTKEGTIRIQEDRLKITYDKFTTDLLIVSDSTGYGFEESESGELVSVALFEGNLIEDNLNNSWSLLFVYTGTAEYFPSKDGKQKVLFLADNERFSIDGSLMNAIVDSSVFQVLEMPFSFSEWKKVSDSRETQFRTNGKVTSISNVTLTQMSKIVEKVYEFRNDLEVGNDAEIKSSPYELSWEGEIDRSPMVQPLPENTNNSEGIITVRFEVRPDGTVGRIIPLRKMNPELEREVMSALRGWRFSRLPGGMPQRTQWGTISFRFVIQ